MLEIPRLPEAVEGDEAADLARLLMGDDRSSSASCVFVDRCQMFTTQPLDLGDKTFRGLFFERLRRPEEVLLALGASIAIHNQQVRLPHGLVVRLDIEMYPSFYDARDGDVPMPEYNEACVGDHSVVLTDIDGQSQRLGINHLFSPEWGRQGRGSLHLDYLISFTRGATAIRSHGGPAVPEEGNESGIDQPVPAPKEVESDEVDLPIENQRRLRYLIDGYPNGTLESPWKLDHLEDEVIWMGRTLIGAGAGDVWIQAALLIRGAMDDPMLIGWMFGRVVGDDAIDIEEFFIWPAYRGHGYGAALAGRTLLFSWAHGIRRARWLELEADAIVNARIGNRKPTWASDFTWIAADASVGWGIERMTDEIPLFIFLQKLGNIHAPGGLHLLWTDGVVHVSDHPTSPAYGLTIARDVPPPSTGGGSSS